MERPQEDQEFEDIRRFREQAGKAPVDMDELEVLSRQLDPEQIYFFDKIAKKKVSDGKLTLPEDYEDKKAFYLTVWVKEGDI